MRTRKKGRLPHEGRPELRRPDLLQKRDIYAPAASPGARANDSAAELSVGGLTFTRSAEISMESEDLMISPDLVTVRYTFRNNAANPVNITVAFPLPDIELADAETYAIPTNDTVNFVGFETKIDGKPIKLNINQ